MKNVLFALTFVFLSISTYAQNTGLIKYVEVRKLSFDIEAPEGMDLAGMLPESTTNYMDLYFEDKRSLYKEGEIKQDNSVEMESDDGGMKIVLKMDNPLDEYYSDIRNGTYLHHTTFMNKEFIIEESSEAPKWKLTGEQIKYLGFVCDKATLSIPATQEEEERMVVAWFTPEITAPVGPGFYNQLPGAILMLSENGDEVEIKATEVELNRDYVDLILEPKKGKRVSQQEFDRIVIEKEKEMNEMYGGSGGIMIRGH